MARHFTFIIFLLFFNAVAYAQAIQRYNCYSYNVNEGLLQSTISEIAFDRDNFCWISFPNGLQKFDGVNFTNIPVQPGLPDDKFVRFFRTNNGDLLLSHSGGISRYVINSNRFVQVYTDSSAAAFPSQFIGQDGNIIYSCSETGRITAMDSRSFTVLFHTMASIAAVASGNGPVIKFSDNIIHHRVGILANYKLYLWDLQQQQLVDSSASLPNISYYLLRLKNENELLYHNYKQGNALQLYSFAEKKARPLFVSGKDEKKIHRCHIYKWQNKQLLSFNNQVFETDSTLQVLKNELVNLQNMPVAGNIGIAKIKEDNHGNLWLQTVSGGIKKINPNKHPLQYYGTQNKEGNNIMCLLPDKANNRVLAGTVGNGLLVFDTLQHLIKHIRTLPGHLQPFTANVIVKKENGDYLLFVNGEKKIWQLSKNLASVSSTRITTSLPAEKSGIQYFGNLLFQDKNTVIAQAQGRIYKVRVGEMQVSEHEFTRAYTMSGIMYANTVITHAGDELIFLDTATFTAVKKVPFPNTGYVRCFAKDRQGHIYIGSNKGIFKTDAEGKILLHLDKTDGLPDECIYAMAIDEAGMLWCSSNRGIFRINSDNSILHLRKEDGLQDNEFNTNTAAVAADGMLFFGGTNGISSFYPSAIKAIPQKIQILLTGISFNNRALYQDTAISTIKEIELPHDKNSLSFDFIAMGPDNPDAYVYQYQMEGIDKEWIQANKVQTVHYLLQPGKYLLKIYAATAFDHNAKALRQLSITIHPPYWRTWWFRLLVSAACVVLLIWLVKLYDRNKYQKKLAELESERKIQLERERISRDLHDNIGAYANAVIYNTELLQKEQEAVERRELMNDLRFASKDIITSLRETIWALKKENYTAADCLLRIRNFVQPFGRYYEHIFFTVNGDAPPHMNLHCTHALNLVRIVQEAVSNAIKHSGASTVTVSSSTENSRWKIVVADNGKGFDKENIDQQYEGNGLSNMQQRAKDSNFELYIDSVQASGTTITVLLQQ